MNNRKESKDKEKEKKEIFSKMVDNVFGHILSCILSHLEEVWNGYNEVNFSHIIHVYLKNKLQSVIDIEVQGNR